MPVVTGRHRVLRLEAAVARRPAFLTLLSSALGWFVRLADRHDYCSIFQQEILRVLYED